jgi:hypothetical protein
VVAHAELGLTASSACPLGSVVFRSFIRIPVARITGLDHGTVFRLLQTLSLLGYVERQSDTRAFRLTLKVLDLGFCAIARLDLRGAAQPA